MRQNIAIHNSYFVKCILKRLYLYYSLKIKKPYIGINTHSVKLKFDELSTTLIIFYYHANYNYVWLAIYDIRGFKVN